ncbi:SufE family protein, partial [bacterium LRH843]|nr:SufE family protein [bacterium LRH843]
MQLSNISLDDLKGNFALFGDDWESKYGYLIELGKALPAFPAPARCEENRVHGCTSRVWMRG